MFWSPNVMLAWCFWSIIFLFSLFPITVHSLFPPKYISLISKNKGSKEGRMRPYDFVFQKIGKYLIDPLKGAAPLTG